MKFVKRITALFLALVMSMAMGITAFADTGNYTITIDNQTSGYTYVAYQVFKGTVNADGVLGNIQWGDNINSTSFLSALKNSDTFKTGDPATNVFASCTTAADVAAVVAGNAFKQTTEDDKTVDSEWLVAFADLAGKYLSGTGKTASYNATNKNYTVSGLAGGYYIVKNTVAPTGESLSRYLIQVVKSTTIKPKAEKPSITKEIDSSAAKDANKPLANSDNKVDTAAIGDVIPFVVTGTVPDTTGYTYYYYVLEDELSKGLTLSTADGEALGDAKTSGTVGYGDLFTVTVGDNTVPYSATKQEGKGVYYVTANTDSSTGKTAIKLVLESVSQYDIGDTIVIKYNAKVNENAVVGTDPNTNTAKIVYSNNPNSSERKDKEDGPNPPGYPDTKVPTGETPDQVTETYVTELTLTKVDATSKGWKDALKGAEFTLVGENLNQIKFTKGSSYVQVKSGESYTGTKYYLLNDGSYTTTAPTTANIDKTAYKDATGNTYYKLQEVATYTTDAQNNRTVTATVDPTTHTIVFTGLNAGTYTLKETHTPDGYNTAKDITFTISASVSGSGENKTFSWSIDQTGKDAGVSLNSGKFAVTVENKLGSLLPSTGGMGTTVVYIAGIAMIVAAGVVVIARKRIA